MDVVLAGTHTHMYATPNLISELGTLKTSVPAEKVPKVLTYLLKCQCIREYEFE